MSSETEKTVITTATLYRPDFPYYEQRWPLARQTVDKARGLGYDIIIVDGGSTDEFLKSIEASGAIIEQAKASGPSSRKECVVKAYNFGVKNGKLVVAYTEPEKHTYVPEIKKTVVPIISEDTHIVIPRRKTLESYPGIQQFVENFGNGFWFELTGRDLDMWFGPRTIRIGLIPTYFSDFECDDKRDPWGATFVPILDAIIDHQDVIGADIDYTHPLEQTRIENADEKKATEKRYKHCLGIMESAVEFWAQRRPEDEERARAILKDRKSQLDLWYLTKH